jgi:multicomponent Na+:H+ antiporter subunit C
MTIIFAAAVAVLFGAGAYLMLKRDLIRLIAGIVLIGNAANLFIMAAALRRGSAAVIPFSGPFSDPVVQSMTLTAIVISFSITALMLALTYRVYGSNASMDLERLAQAEEEEVTRDELNNGEGDALFDGVLGAEFNEDDPDGAHARLQEVRT